MGCFCKDTVQALADTVEKLADRQQKCGRVTSEPRALDTADDSDRPDDPAPTAADPGQEQVAKLARWIQTRQPQTPWHPDPTWLTSRLPSAPLEPAAMATLVGLAQAQKQIMQSLAIDLLQPDQAKNFRRVVATLNDRCKDLPPAPDPTPWQELASQASALQQVEQAAAQDLFKDKPDVRKNAEQPGGVKLSEWRDFYQQVKDLTPLLAVAQQLGVELADPEAAAKIAQKLRPLRSVTLPPIETPWTIAQYTTLARALSEIADVLGVDAAEQDPAQLQNILAQRRNKLLETLPDADPPALPASVANVVTPDVVKALQAVKPQTLQAMNWKVPPATQFPLVVTGLPAIAFIDTLNRMKTDAVRASPCGQQCDASALLRQSDESAGKSEILNNS